jgi:hypothetical protein
MASTPDSKDYPYTENHVAMWGTFCTIAKWVTILSVISLILMAAFLTGDHRAIGG